MNKSLKNDNKLYNNLIEFSDNEIMKRLKDVKDIKDIEVFENVLKEHYNLDKIKLSEKCKEKYNNEKNNNMDSLNKNIKNKYQEIRGLKKIVYELTEKKILGSDRDKKSAEDGIEINNIRIQEEEKQMENYKTSITTLIPKMKKFYDDCISEGTIKLQNSLSLKLLEVKQKGEQLEFFKLFNKVLDLENVLTHDNKPETTTEEVKPTGEIVTENTAA